MDIFNLQEGQTVKNYKVLCEMLGEPVKSGKSKILQIKNWSRYFDFSRNGLNFVINKIYEIPSVKVDLRGGGNYKLKTPLSITNPKLASQWLEVENGMKLPDTLTRNSDDEYWWMCTTCTHKFLSSPKKRFNKCTKKTDEYITCLYCSLSKGAKIIYDFLESHKILFDLEYMFDDLLGLGNKKLRFDFALFNGDKLIALIEFDGGYHDEDLNPDKENFITISNHDTKKNEYCIRNNISLLRIHHSDINIIKIILSNYLTTLGILKEYELFNYIKSTIII